MEKIRFFKGAVPSKARFHVTIGHVTVMAHVVFFSGPTSAGAPTGLPDVVQQASSFSFDQEYSFQDELAGASTLALSTRSRFAAHTALARRRYDRR